MIILVDTEQYESPNSGGGCGCDEEHLWYDEDLKIWRCRNCGWCS